MKYFSAFYMMPVAELDKWMQKPAEEREPVETEFKQKWDAWLAGHKDSVLNTIAIGKVKVVTEGGIEDARNEMMLSSYIQAASLEAAADIFKDHPHLTMPGGRIEVVETREM
jgi:hypothetical protein